jgi:hypothetical protein
MQQRKEAPDSLDHFPTPPWGTRALCEWLKSIGEPLDIQTCWECACAEGHMSRALMEYFGNVHSSDVHDYGYGEVADFLWASSIEASWIVTNPPFRLAHQFITTALERSKHGVAMLTRIAFLEGQDRYDGTGPKGCGVGLFEPNPPSDVLVFTERLPMFKGKLKRSSSTATCYVWCIWRKGAPAMTQLHWIAPCRRRLERDADYL